MPSGNGAEGGAGEPLCVVVKMVVVFHDGRKPKAPDELGELALPRSAGGELRLQIAHHLVGQPHVGGHHVPDPLHPLARLHELHIGNAQTLLVDLVGGERIRPGDDAADVRVVGERAGPAG